MRPSSVPYSLLLIHQPYNDVYGTWRAMEELQKQGKVRAIGISNFSVERAVNLALFNEVIPQVNQIEINPFKAWAPFAEGKNNIFTNPVLEKIGQKYGKSVAQVIIRWLVEQDTIVLAKSINSERMAENLAVFDFKLADEDKAAITILNEGESQFFSHSAPETIKLMANRKSGI